MTRNLKFWIAGIVILIAAFLYLQRKETRYAAPSEPIFSGKTDAVEKVRVQTPGDTLELVRQDDTWRIVGHDTLEVRENRIDDLMTRVLGTNRSTIMTEKTEKWPTYSVDDATGTHLTVVGKDDAALGKYVFGRSKSDWSKNYVRVPPDPTVYLTDSNVMYTLSTSPTYWGVKPKPPEPDSLKTDSLQIPPATPALAPAEADTSK